MLIRITIRSNIIAGAIFKILSRSFYAEILALQGFPAGLRDSYFIRDKSGYPEFRNNQTFSVAGARRGFSDPRGTLFFEIARLVEARHPAYLILENVPYALLHIRYIFKQAAGKTAKSILVSVGVRLAAFNLQSIAKLTMTDELHLQELGERKIALFCCIPDSDKSLNYLVGMIYTQLIQTLYRQADRVHKGRLPVPVHCLMDEYANISLPKDTFLSALATMRSRAIFCSIIVQNMAQLKAMYKDDWESLVGLCDEFLYLGGTEKETHKYVSELLGKETISTTSYNQSKGRSGSYSINHQQSGRDVP